MSISNDPDSLLIRNKHVQKTTAWAIHLFTSIGIVLGFLSLLSVLAGDKVGAFLWLAGALFVDGVDGTLARKFNVKKNLPHIDGKMLDSIIDFFNYVIIPSVMIYWFRYVPDQFILLIPAILIFISICIFN